MEQPASDKIDPITPIAAIRILEMLAGLGYLTLLWQPLVQYIYPYNLALAGPGEISVLLWLLIKGVKNNVSIDKQ